MCAQLFVESVSLISLCKPWCPPLHCCLHINGIVSLEIQQIPMEAKEVRCNVVNVVARTSLEQKPQGWSVVYQWTLCIVHCSSMSAI